MGNLLATSESPKVSPLNSSPLKECLLIERIVASQCDYLKPNRFEDTIRVGVIGRGTDPNNPLSHQAIRIGDSEAYRLQSVQEGADTLHYTFDKNVSLTLMKRKNSVVYHLKTPEYDVTREVNPAIAKFYKPIGLDCEELDKIQKIYRLE